MRLRTLYDVNVLLALIDPDHPHFAVAHAWHAENRLGWASTATTQNGFLRTISRPAYSGAIRQDVAIALLQDTCANTDHQFWAEDISLLDDACFDSGNIHGHRQITDAYLLAVAIRHGGRLATFDRRIPVAAVRKFRPEHYVLLG